MIKIKRRLHVFLEDHPSVAGYIRKLHAPLFWLWKLRIRMRSRWASGGLVDPHKTLRVDPADVVDAINWADEKGFDRFTDRGKVMGGDWDLDVMPFAEKDLYKSFVARFKEGTPWNETEYYKVLLADVESGSCRRGMRSSVDLDKRMGAIDRLYEGIKSSGYLPIPELRDAGTSSVGDEDEVCVRIGRHGDLLFEDGRHRLAIAKILGVPEIPVKVIARHVQWMAFVKEVYAYAAEHKGELYNVIPHPDLADIPAMHGWDRFEMIKPFLPSPPGHVLDIGCHWGFFCIQLEKMGFDCTGVEVNERYQYFLKKIRRACRAQFKLVEGSAFDLSGDRTFDVVIALYIFHHFLKSKLLHQELIDFLGSLDVNAMLFGCHNTDQEAMQDAYRNYSHEAFVAFVLEYSCLSRATRIGTEMPGREIYWLER